MEHQNQIEGRGIDRYAQAQACGKAILIGEHAVVYGARAIAIPLPSLNTQVTATRLGIAEEFRDGRDIKMFFGGKPVTDHIRGAVVDAFRVLGIAPFPLKIDGSAAGLVGAGLGSSASLCVVLLRGLAAICQRPLSCQQLATLANDLEKRFHGSPSGLDAAVVAFEKMITFSKGLPPRILQTCSQAMENMKTRWRFALVDTGLRSPTMTMIHAAAPYFQGSEGIRRAQAFDGAAQEAEIALGAGDELALADQMERAGRWLDEAGVVNDRMREIMTMAKRMGALAAKPTGAGGGGCILTLLPRDHAAEILTRLKTFADFPWIHEVTLP